MKRSLLLWIAFFVFLTATLLRAATAAEPSDRASTLQEILILNSYHPGYAWSDDEQAGIIDVLRAKDENWLPVIEYLDLKRLPDGRHLANLKQLFRSKYQNKKFSVVIAMDNPALEFAMDNQAELFRNAPIVFCGINNYSPSLLKGHSNVTGIAESIDITGTIEAMLLLHPAAREIFVTHDYTVTGLAVRKEIEALVPRFGAKVRFRFTVPLTMEELLKELERLPKDSLVLEIGFITDKSGRTFGMTETTKLFSEHSPVPIYSTFEQRLGSGIIGGKLLSARHHGTHAARIALRVLAGEKASAIPVVLESDSQFMFDYKVMSRFGIPLSALPEGSIVINKTVSFYAAHRAAIQATLGIIGFLVVVISLLAINIIQRRRATEVIRRSQEKLIEAHRLAHIGVWNWVTETDTVLWTEELYRIAGLDPMLPAPTYAEHPNIYAPESWDLLKEAVERAIKTGEPYNLELKLIRPDGTTRWVNAFGGATYDNHGRIEGLQGTVHDITDRRLAEVEKRRLEERSRKVVEDIFRFIPEGVLVFSRKMELLRQNQAFRELVSGYAKRLGFAEDELENLIVDKIKAAMGDENMKEISISRKHETGEQT